MTAGCSWTSSCLPVDILSPTPLPTGAPTSFSAPTPDPTPFVMSSTAGPNSFPTPTTAATGATGPPTPPLTPTRNPTPAPTRNPTPVPSFPATMSPTPVPNSSPAPTPSTGASATGAPAPPTPISTPPTPTPTGDVWSSSLMAATTSGTVSASLSVMTTAIEPDTSNASTTNGSTATSTVPDTSSASTTNRSTATSTSTEPGTSSAAPTADGSTADGIAEPAPATGLIIGASVGGVIGLSLFVVLGVFLCRRRSRPPAAFPTPNASTGTELRASLVEANVPAAASEYDRVSHLLSPPIVGGSSDYGTAPVGVYAGAPPASASSNYSAAPATLRDSHYTAAPATPATLRDRHSNAAPATLRANNVYEAVDAPLD
jgi:hypothetical protein